MALQAGSLDGTVCWVTGAGTGIGEAAALALAGLGAKVVLSGRRAEALDEVAEKIGPSAATEPLDVADAAATAAVADRIAAEHGRLDVLVANAGLNVRDRHFDKLSVTDWDLQVQVNLNGAYYCARAALPHMRRQGEGLIVNVASWAGRFHGYGSGPAYSASKHGMVSLTHSLNIEEGPNGIRACVVCPGEVATPILDQRPDPVSPELRAKLLQPEDVADIIAFAATTHPRVVLNEIVVSPRHNRGQLAMLGAHRR